MTIPFLSVKPSAIKLKAKPDFPALVSATAPLTLSKVNGNFTFGLDLTALTASLVPIFAGTYLPLGGGTMTGALVQRPAALVTPTNNGDLTVQATSNTQLTFKFKGSDGVVRSANLTLA